MAHTQSFDFRIAACYKALELTNMKQVGIYLRVSTNVQTTENQKRELQAVAKRSGWRVVGVYEDNGIRGAKSRDERPGLDRMMKDATARKINMIAAWSVDRLGRSLQDLVGFLNELHALRCHLYLHQQSLDTSTPSGRAMFQMCGVCRVRARDDPRAGQRRIGAGQGKGHAARPTAYQACGGSADTEAARSRHGQAQDRPHARDR